MTRTINRNGVEFNVVTDTLNAGFWNFDQWESANYKILKDMSETHDTIVQAGGWIGAFTLYCAKLYENVYCLEPDPTARKELIRNIECNNFKNIQLFDKAFYSRNTRISIGSDFSPLGESGTSMKQTGHSVIVETTTLMDFYDENKLPKRTMLMLDIEGAEYLMFNDKSFFEKYIPTVNMSFHLPFLEDYEFDHMIEHIENLKDIYKIDTSYLKERRKDNLFHDHYVNGVPEFTEFSCLFEPL